MFLNVAFIRRIEEATFKNLIDRVLATLAEKDH
jgi:hypothetical protein